MEDPTKMAPQGLCRRLVSAPQEMEVIDEILASAKKSDFQIDNLSKKKEYLLEWDGCFGICPFAECKIHNTKLKSNQLQNTTKSATSEISSRNDKFFSGDIRGLHEIKIVFLPQSIRKDGACNFF
ncbi:hypothetical protein CDAR_119171 [Caerostris darwini]|uniref:Uncharacterized protein n=1 Tax=Caerostris darwini TaxID=1538125 RepID=A0AAV4PY15_9ARAC|nr:hypothetical protein CDAR_119171 [Caerostris darwini]